MPPDTVLVLVGPGPGLRVPDRMRPVALGALLWRAVPGYAHKGRNNATQHRTQRLDSALVCERRCLIRGPCVRTSRRKGTGGALTARPHEAPSQYRLGAWVEDHDLLLWGKVVNAPDGAGCSLTANDSDNPKLAIILVLMHLMVLGAP